MWRAQVVQLKEDGMNAPFRFRKTSGVHSFALIYAQLANYMPLLSRARLPATHGSTLCFAADQCTAWCTLAAV
jgi:hypothetical protein